MTLPIYTVQSLHRLSGGGMLKGVDAWTPASRALSAFEGVTELGMGRPASGCRFSRSTHQTLISHRGRRAAKLKRSWPPATTRTHRAGAILFRETELQGNQNRIDDKHLANLMRSAQDGDAEAFQSLLQRITPILRSAVLRKVWSSQTQNAEDIIQEILLSVHTARATYNPDRPFLPWLMAIVRNRIADAARRDARHAAHEVAVERLPEICSDTDQHAVLCSSDDRRQLRSAIDQLPPAQRRAVELLKLREMTMKEAEAATGMSIGALKVSVHRAIKTLGTLLDKEAWR